MIHDFVDDVLVHPECPLKRLPDKTHFSDYILNRYIDGYMTGIYEVLDRLEKETR